MNEPNPSRLALRGPRPKVCRHRPLNRVQVEGRHVFLETEIRFYVADAQFAFERLRVNFTPEVGDGSLVCEHEVEGQLRAPVEILVGIHRQDHAPDYELSHGGIPAFRAAFKAFRRNVFVLAPASLAETRSGLCIDGATAGMRAESFFISETSGNSQRPRAPRVSTIKRRPTQIPAPRERQTEARARKTRAQRGEKQIRLKFSYGKRQNRTISGNPQRKTLKRSAATQIEKTPLAAPGFPAKAPQFLLTP